MKKKETGAAKGKVVNTTYEELERYVLLVIILCLICINSMNMKIGTNPLGLENIGLFVAPLYPKCIWYKASILRLLINLTKHYLSRKWFSL